MALSKKKKLTILPREPLTQKAKSAIETYVIMTGTKKGNFIYVLVKACLQAERMRRSDLYRILEEHGFVWKNGYWRKHDETEITRK